MCKFSLGWFRLKNDTGLALTYWTCFFLGSGNTVVHLL